MLSDSLIRSLKLGDKKRHTDRDGLVLELRPSKKQLKKIFIFRFQWDKKPQTITIGEYRSIGLGAARACHQLKSVPLSTARSVGERVG